MRIIDRPALEDLSRKAAGRERLRLNLNVHRELSDPVQRLFNAVEPGTYVRPHRHAPDRWELFVILRGRAVVLEFDERGTVLERCELAPQGPGLAVEIPGGTWHTVAALEPETLLFEVKPGPYAPLRDKDFAPWAPPEGRPEAAGLQAWFRRAAPGERPPSA